MGGTTVFWYASRATGIVALLLLTAVLVLGILVNRQGRLPGLPRFAVTDLHKNLSLLAVAFIAVHVFTAVLDTYVHIPLLSAVVPFASGYERLWLGLGAISLDMMIASGGYQGGALVAREATPYDGKIVIRILKGSSKWALAKKWARIALGVPFGPSVCPP